MSASLLPEPARCALDSGHNGGRVLVVRAVALRYASCRKRGREDFPQIQHNPAAKNPFQSFCFTSRSTASQQALQRSVCERALQMPAIFSFPSYSHLDEIIAAVFHLVQRKSNHETIRQPLVSSNFMPPWHWLESLVSL